jgi:hypothetical protein
VAGLTCCTSIVDRVSLNKSGTHAPDRNSGEVGGTERTMSESRFTQRGSKTSVCYGADSVSPPLEFGSLKLHSLHFSQSDGPDLIHVILLTSSN